MNALPASDPPLPAQPYLALPLLLLVCLALAASATRAQGPASARSGIHPEVYDDYVTEDMLKLHEGPLFEVDDQVRTQLAQLPSAVSRDHVLPGLRTCAPANTYPPLPRARADDRPASAEADDPLAILSRLLRERLLEATPRQRACLLQTLDHACEVQ